MISVVFLESIVYSVIFTSYFMDEWFDFSAKFFWRFSFNSFSYHHYMYVYVFKNSLLLSIVLCMLMFCCCCCVILHYFLLLMIPYLILLLLIIIIFCCFLYSICVLKLVLFRCCIGKTTYFSLFQNINTIGDIWYAYAHA